MKEVELTWKCCFEKTVTVLRTKIFQTALQTCFVAAGCCRGHSNSGGVTNQTCHRENLDTQSSWTETNILVVTSSVARKADEYITIKAAEGSFALVWKCCNTDYSPSAHNSVTSRASQSPFKCSGYHFLRSHWFWGASLASLTQTTSVALLHLESC